MFILTTVDEQNNVHNYSARTLSGLVNKLVDDYYAVYIARQEVIHGDDVWPVIYQANPSVWREELAELNEGLSPADDGYIFAPPIAEITPESVCLVARRLLNERGMVAAYKDNRFRVFPMQ